MTERKIICKLLTGSKLYGTNHPDSDDDYVGVFLPSSQDLLGLQNCPTEWSESVKKSSGERNVAGDIDCKYFSLQSFFNLASQGQPTQLEMLFTPKFGQLLITEEWQQVLDNKDIFLSKNCIVPFIGFALAQSHKGTIKGFNLRTIRSIIDGGSKLTKEQLGDTLKNTCTIITTLNDERKGSLLFPLGDSKYQPLDISVNDQNFQIVEIAGKKYDVELKVKTFIDNLKELTNRYGSRPSASAKEGHDLKSYLHAYRLLAEAKEFLQTNNIIFPRPDAEFLKSIRAGEYNVDFYSEITEAIDEIRQKIEPLSSLQKTSNKSKIEELCQSMLYKHLFGQH